MKTAVILPLVSLFAASLLAGTASADLLVVDDDGGPGVDYTTLQPALDAAGPGDVLLLRPGDYHPAPAFPPAPHRLVGKGLSIVADGSVRVHGLRIEDLPAGQDVLVRGIDLGDANLQVVDCAGVVWLEDIVSQGQNFVAVQSPVRIEDSAAVHLNRCELYAGQSLTFPPVALRASHSNVSVYDSVLHGADGYGDIQTGSDGVLVVGGFLFASGTDITGGSSGCAGDGLEIAGGGSVVALDSSVGAGTPFDCETPPLQGLGVRVVEGTFTETAGSARTLAIESPAVSAGPADFHYQGEPGDLVLLAFAPAMGSTYLPGVGTLQTGLAVSTLANLGNADANGAIELTVTVPAIGVGSAVALPLQVIAIAGQEIAVSGGTALVIVAP